MKLVKKILKMILIVGVAAFIIVQFIRPVKNISEGPSEHAISRHYPVPAHIQQVLERSCFDCHSNNTVYPWYAEIQPMGWWLADHIEHGTSELNFDEFATYAARRQFIKLRQIEEEITEEAMPLPSYLIAHSDAVLSAEDKSMLIDWTLAVRDSIKRKYPVDSLERRRMAN